MDPDLRDRVAEVLSRRAMLDQPPMNNLAPQSGPNSIYAFTPPQARPPVSPQQPQPAQAVPQFDQEHEYAVPGHSMYRDPDLEQRSLADRLYGAVTPGISGYRRY